jgi:NAD(P)-dependent dehydrogenase (short-subunit alcohol dehydrogenase family)
VGEGDERQSERGLLLYESGASPDVKARLTLPRVRLPPRMASHTIHVHLRLDPLIHSGPSYANSGVDSRRAQRGAIVNICSINSHVATKRNAAYVTSKHGILGLTKTCAIDYAEERIRCNGISPGYVETPASPAHRLDNVLWLTILDRSHWHRRM